MGLGANGGFPAPTPTHELWRIAVVAAVVGALVASVVGALVTVLLVRLLG